MEQEPAKPKRRSFYIADDVWYPFQSKLWADRTDASKWIRQAILQYLSPTEDSKSSNN